MKKAFKILTIAVIGLTAFTLTSCLDGTTSTADDINNQIAIGDKFAQNQPTPTDINYSLERYNLIRRAYWVNGMREKAISLPCEITKPLGYIYLFTESGNIIGQFTVDGKVSSLTSYLTPSYNPDHNGSGASWETELPDVDGCYGSNDPYGIFFFTPDGKYIEWTGTYMYSDIPFNVSDTVLK